MDDQPAQSGSSDGVMDPAQQLIARPVSGGGNKEMETGGGNELQVEAVEVKEPETLPEGVAGWMERIERGEDINLPQPVTYNNQTLVTASSPQSVSVVLPLTKNGLERGLHLKVVDSLRWLSEWCVRIIKKFPGKVLYRRVKLDK